MLEMYVPEIEFTPVNSYYSHLLLANVSYLMPLSK
jgi:hypothetical protein